MGYYAIYSPERNTYSTYIASQSNKLKYYNTFQIRCSVLLIYCKFNKRRVPYRFGHVWRLYFRSV